METMLLAVFHIAFVTAVYCAAYRRGIRDGQARTRVFLERFDSPLADLVEKLNRDVEKSVHLNKDKPQDPPRGD